MRKPIACQLKALLVYVIDAAASLPLMTQQPGSDEQLRSAVG